MYLLFCVRYTCKCVLSFSLLLHHSGNIWSCITNARYDWISQNSPNKYCNCFSADFVLNNTNSKIWSFRSWRCNSFSPFDRWLRKGFASWFTKDEFSIFKNDKTCNLRYLNVCLLMKIKPLMLDFSFIIELIIALLIFVD